MSLYIYIERECACVSFKYSLTVVIYVKFYHYSTKRKGGIWIYIEPFVHQAGKLSFTLKNAGDIPLKKPMIFQTGITLVRDIQIYPWSMLEYHEKWSSTYEVR